MGSGVAVLDYDGDGLVDVFFLDGGAPGEGRSAASLYRGDGRGGFTRVPDPGFGPPFLGMGCAAAIDAERYLAALSQ